MKLNQCVVLYALYDYADVTYYVTLIWSTIGFHGRMRCHVIRDILSKAITAQSEHLCGPFSIPTDEPTEEKVI